MRERLASDKHSSLLVPFVSYSENEVFMGPVTLCYITPAGKACNSSLLLTFTSYSENEVLWLQLLSYKTFMSAINSAT
jgi:hypothetical protein